MAEAGAGVTGASGPAPNGSRAPEAAAAPGELRERFITYVRELQDAYVLRLEALDGRATFGRDAWERPGGGGGVTRALADGDVFERGGVNVSVVQGTLSARMAERLGGGDPEFFAAGISLILHPRSPMVPTVHMNLRYFEKASGDRWFGGGADLTPHYLEEDDAAHFHRTLAAAAAVLGADAYARMKDECDAYFRVKHRGEGRGVGGIFFDYVREDAERTFTFVRAVGDNFLAAYVPIVEKRRAVPWGERERNWQLLRRGRYVEFNLVHDRGTLFGLETEGRIESILVSMPPLAAWAYAHEPEPGSREAELIEVLRRPRAWVP